MSDHIPDAGKMVSDTPRTDAAYFNRNNTFYQSIGEMKQIERELNAAKDRIKLLETALNCVSGTCSTLYHSKKHQHKKNEPCPVEELIRKAKEAKP